MVGTPGIGGTLGLSITESDRQVMTQMIQQLQQGHLNCTVQATLNPNATSTTVTAATCTANSTISGDCALTADAAAVKSSIWFAPASGQFVVHHPSSTAVDMTFRFIIIG